MEDYPHPTCYRLLTKLGEGQTASVYLGESLDTGREFAVKVFKATQGAYGLPFSESSRQFLRELEILSISTHPNVVRLADFGQTLGDQEDFIVLECVHGEDFVTASKNASQHQFYSMIIQVCRALDFLNSRGIAHGDLKPQNILVVQDATSDGQSPTVRLVDLGYARTLRDDADAVAFGTPHYLAPEIIAGQRPSIKSDLYSFGAVLYECLVGTPPYTGSEIGAILQKHLQEPPPRLESGPLKELHPIIYQLLSKDPSRRPSSPAELFRLVNLISPVGRFPLHTTATWQAHFISCPLVARDQIISDSSRMLMEMVNDQHALRPVTIVLEGESGSGKSRLVREIAILARSFGHSVLNLPPGFDAGQVDWIQPTIAQVASQRPKRPIFITYDGTEGCTSRAITLFQNMLRAHKDTQLLFLLTVDTAAVPPESLQRTLERLRSISECLVYRLLPFDDCQIQQLLLRALGVSATDPNITTHLRAQAGGNPAITIELLAAYLDQQVIVKQNDSLLTRESLENLKTPNTVTTTLHHVLNSLSTDASRLVQLLAATHGQLRASDIASLTAFDIGHVAALCEHLERCGTLRVDHQKECHRFSISSELLRTATLERIQGDSKVLLYERLAEWYLSNTGENQSIEHAATSYAAAGRSQEAIHYYTMAARTAEKKFDLNRAVRLQRFALDQGPEDPFSRAEVTLHLAVLLCRLGRLTESLRLLDSIVINATMPAALRAGMHICRARCQMDMGDFIHCLQSARSGHAIAHHAGLTLESIQAMLQIGFALCSLNQRLEGQRTLFRAAAKARRAGLGIKAGIALVDVASSFWRAGNYRRALEYQRRAYRLLHNRAAPQDEAAALFNIGVLLSELGLYSRSRSSHRSALNIARRESLKTLLGTISINIGETYRAQGAWPITVSHCRSAMRALGDLGAELALLTANSNMAYAFARAGHYEEALRGLRHKMRVAQRFGSTQAICLLLVSWAVILISTGRYDSTSRLTAFACRHAEGAGLWGSILELKVLMALSMAAGGRLEEARDLLSSAIESFKNRAPFDIKLGADIALSRIEQNVGAPVTAIEERLKSVIQTARAKKMRWHLASALMLRAEGMLATNRLEEAEVALQEASATAESTADRCLYWQASYLMGRVFEQRLQYERALSFYRAAALTIHELALDLEDEKYKAPFLEQPKVREVLERFDRLRGEVGKRVRFDLAAMSRSEKISRRMLGALNAIGQRLASILDLNELLAYLLDLSIENVRAERGIIFLLEEASGEMRLECARGMDKGSLDEVSSFSRSVIRQVAQGQTLLTVDVGKDPALSAYKSLVLHEIKSILCVPMKARGKVAGVIYLDTRRAAQLFTDRERAFVESFASQAAIAIENARLFGQMSAENVRLRKEVEWRSRFDNLIGTSPAMKKLTDMIAGVLDSDCGVLIVGESGTGKELVARAIHYNGPRRKKEFMAIDCGALPENLLEAELFGYVRGAFTGADKDRVGLIEQAHGGSLFLDEITNTSLALQARLLRVLQEHEVRRLGENRSRRVDVRVIAATNSDMSSLVRSGHFRQDLYYRLDVVTIAVPALRERREDIPLLADHFLKGHTKEGIVSKELGPGVRQVLSEHDWPGNVRELQNVIQRAVVLARGSVITVNDLPEGLRQAAPSTEVEANGNGNGSKTGEQLMIEDALRRFSGDKAKAARFIGWNRQKLYRRMKTFSIPPDYGRLV